MTLADLQARMYRRLGEDPSNPQWWTVAEATAALNWAQRLFCLLTLCLEDQRPLDLTPGKQYYHMLQEPQFLDWFAPLRVRFQNTQRAGNNAEFAGAQIGAPVCTPSDSCRAETALMSGMTLRRSTANCSENSG